MLQRLYGAHADVVTREHFLPAVLDEERAAFWRRVRPLDGDVDYAAIEADAARRGARWRNWIRGAPWYVANGVYNEITERARRWAKR